MKLLYIYEWPGDIFLKGYPKKLLLLVLFDVLI